MGFDYFYGFMGGESDQWTPWLFRDHTQIFPWEDDPGYNMITGMADDAINYLREVDAAAAGQAVLHLLRARRHPRAAPADPGMDRQVQGQVRHGLERHARRDLRQPEAARRDPGEHQADPLAGRPAEVGHARAPTSKKMFARQAEVFAAYVAYADHEIGRVIDEVRRQGKLENTLVIYIEGDNGTSAEGSTIGTAFDLAAIQGDQHAGRGPAEVLRRLGRADDQPHMSVAWSWAFDTPFKWTKQIASHFGGTRQGMVMSWPGHITDKGGVRSQFHHVIDIVPTILEATGIEAPQTVNGIAQKPIEGVSMAYTWSQGRAGRARPRARPSISRCSGIARSTTTAGSPRPRRRPGPG